VKLAGTTNRHENWTNGYVLERDEETGEVTKQVEAGVPIELSKQDQDKLEALGAVFEKSSADEAKEVAEEREAQPLVTDTSAAGPRFGTSSEPNQSVSTPDKGDEKKSNN